MSERLETLAAAAARGPLPARGLLHPEPGIRRLVARSWTLAPDPARVARILVALRAEPSELVRIVLGRAALAAGVPLDAVRPDLAEPWVHGPAGWADPSPITPGLRRRLVCGEACAWFDSAPGSPVDDPRARAAIGAWGPVRAPRDPDEAWALGELGDPAAIAPLVAALRDPGLAPAAAGALRKLRAAHLAAPWGWPRRDADADAGIAALVTGDGYAAHDAFELAWRRAAGDRRRGLYALIHASVALAHVGHGRIDAARRRWAASVRTRPGPAHTLGLEGWLDRMDRWFDAGAPGAPPQLSVSDVSVSTS